MLSPWRGSVQQRESGFLPNLQLQLGRRLAQLGWQKLLVPSHAQVLALHGLVMHSGLNLIQIKRQSIGLAGVLGGSLVWRFPCGLATG